MFINRIIKSGKLLILSLVLHIVLTLPLLAFVIIDGTIQQQIYMHFAAHFGKHDIAFIGDSITAGGYVWAKKIGVLNLNVWNYGKGGFDTKNITFYAKRVAKEHFKYCFVMSGRNDEIENNATVLKSYNEFIDILKILKNANVEPIVTLMLYKEKDAFQEYIDEYNNKIRTYCINNNITVIDLNSFLSDKGGLKKDYTIDGTHINSKAYSIWGREIRNVLVKKKYL